jgi:hypothetical protein
MGGFEMGSAEFVARTSARTATYVSDEVEESTVFGQTTTAGWTA